MDNNNGKFEGISNKIFEEKLLTENPQVFRVGEVIEVRGSRLRVHKMYKNKITFKLLPKQNKKP